MPGNDLRLPVLHLAPRSCLPLCSRRDPASAEPPRIPRMARHNPVQNARRAACALITRRTWRVPRPTLCGAGLLPSGLGAAWVSLDRVGAAA
jgi:hypothetical protein